MIATDSIAPMQHSRIVKTDPIDMVDLSIPVWASDSSYSFNHSYCDRAGRLDLSPYCLPSCLRMCQSMRLNIFQIRLFISITSSKDRVFYPLVFCYSKRYIR